MHYGLKPNGPMHVVWAEDKAKTRGGYNSAFTYAPGPPRKEITTLEPRISCQVHSCVLYLVDVHLTIPIDIRLLYEEVDLRVGQLGAQLSHNVSELLGVDRPRPVLVEKLFCSSSSGFGEAFPAGITVAQSFHRVFGNGTRKIHDEGTKPRVSEATRQRQANRWIRHGMARCLDRTRLTPRDGVH